MNERNTHIENKHQNAIPENAGLIPGEKLLLSKAEEERLRQDIYRSDMEKFLLFTRMLRRNVIFKKAKITHKQ